ncbi:DinB family protein [Salinispora arenicola]|uniref:DinB family protein n=1 Tax=Salinispora arenicola TaxID=168697 RepID=UPI0014302483|nr:DinB family protein [Salinispora arenicola]NIL41427.1 DinB family protein [Salinispora arenicola]
MTWRAPEIDRRHEPYLGAERALLTGWLDYHRDTLLHKCAGLSADQLRTASVEPSPLSLLGLIRHMTYVERAWFRQRFAGQDVPDPFDFTTDPDAEFRVETADPEAELAAFRAEIAAADAAADGRDLDEEFTLRRQDGSSHQLSLRWVYLHMIEEYARHNGHADLIRERLDGVTGD